MLVVELSTQTILRENRSVNNGPCFHEVYGSVNDALDIISLTSLII